jgi:hypothetical protein
MALDKYPEVGDEYYNELKRLIEVHKSQIWDYLQKTYENEKYNFWLLMARDFKSEFKAFLISHGYDGIFADEQLKDPYDIKDPSQFTNTFIIFDASQVKLADGRNLKFDPMSADIRYENGAELDMPYTDEAAPQILLKGGNNEPKINSSLENVNPFMKTIKTNKFIKNKHFGNNISKNTSSFYKKKYEENFAHYNSLTEDIKDTEKSHLDSLQIKENVQNSLKIIKNKIMLTEASSDEESDNEELNLQ